MKISEPLAKLATSWRRILLGALLLVASAGPARAIDRYIEEFDTATFKDAANTTADWNTAAGKLQLFPFLPSLLGAYDTPGLAVGVAVSGTVAYIADGASGLQIVNVSNPASPTLLGTYNTPGNAVGVAVSGTVAYVADGVTGLLLISVSNPASPTLLGTYDTPGSAYDVAISGTVAYVADGAVGLQVINVSNPASPTLLGNYCPAFCLGLGEAVGIAISGTVAYVADLYYLGLWIIDVSNPASPTLLGTYDTPGSARGVAVSGTVAYVAEEDSGLEVFEVMQQRFDTPRNVGRSLAIDNSVDAIRRVRLSSTQVNDVAWELSANGGGPWQAATPNGSWLPFTSGSDLRWRATLSVAGPSLTATPPEVSRVEIEWLYLPAVIRSIADVGNDQGGRVRLRFERSGNDIVGETLPVTGYQIYHRVDDVALASRVREEGSIPNAAESPSLRMDSFAAASLRRIGDRAFVLGGEQAAGTFPPGIWETVGWVAATQSDSYLALVPTTGDSTSSGIEWSVFLLTVHTTDPLTWYVGHPDSGYSVDNLAPNVPTGFVAGYQSGVGNQLDWDEPVDADFRYFKVYRSTNPNFTPGPGNLVHSTISSAWTDASPGGPAYYKLTAVDFAGNESGPATANVTVGVEPPALPVRFALHAASPNPFADATVIGFDVPNSGGRVHLRVYDLGGRLVRSLVDGPQAPGTRRVAWDGRDDRGHRMPAGVYLCRLRAPGFAQMRKLLLAR